MFIAAAIPALVYGLISLRLPESPRYLVAKGDVDAQGHVYWEITDAGSAEVAQWLASPVERSGGTRSEGSGEGGTGRPRRRRRRRTGGSGGDGSGSAAPASSSD